jgi:predicted metal-dependent hydrolase
MKKIIKTHSGTIPYTMKSMRRSKSVRLIVHGDGTLVLTKPLWVSVKTAESFLHDKIEWIIEKVRIAREKHANAPTRQETQEEYAKLRKRALRFVTERTAYINREFYEFEYQKISVRNQKTRWGSCSKAGNLSFSYRIILLSPECADYLIAHELCHLKEFNHSEKFWKLVAKASPRYRTLRREMKRM